MKTPAFMATTRCLALCVTAVFLSSCGTSSTQGAGERLIFDPAGGTAVIAFGVDSDAAFDRIGLVFNRLGPDGAPVDLYRAGVDKLTEPDLNIKHLGLLYCTESGSWDRKSSPVHDPACRYIERPKYVALEVQPGRYRLDNVGLINSNPEDSRKDAFVWVTHEKSALIYEFKAGQAYYLGDFKLRPTPLGGSGGEDSIGLVLSAVTESGQGVLNFFRQATNINRIVPQVRRPADG